jgi:hypothetical protein
MGERNQETVTLVRNWCAHARIDRFGGAGVLEQMSGVPIGPHGVICDYAPAGGLYSPDLAIAALDFHDRHCVGCEHRKPVGLPNLSVLLGEREAATKAAADREQAASLAYETARAARQAVRVTLRSQVDAVAATTVDQISALDGEGDATTAEALVASARMAPEAFPPLVVDYLFDVLEAQEGWAVDSALDVLLQLGADPCRLARAALQVLRGHSAGETAAKVMLATLDHVDERAIPGALPELIELALPLELPIPHGGPPPRPDGLLALHARYPRVVESALEDLLATHDIDRQSFGARGVEVVALADRAAAKRLARAAVSKLARGRTFDDDYGSGGQAVHALREAVAEAYRADPDATEALMTSFAVGATAKGQARLFAVYREVLGRPFDKMEGEPTAAQHAVMRRLLRAINESLPDEVRQEVHSVFQGSPRELKPLAAHHIDALLGAALLLDDRIQQLAAEVKAPAPDFLSSLERRNRDFGAHQLQKNLVNWAAEAAAGDLGASRQYLLLLDSLPEDRDGLRAVMVGRFRRLIVSPETFSLFLPPLYGALVGASTLTRGSAAKVVGELPDRFVDDAPPLLLEAFVALMNDPYVYVVTSVISALRRTPLPEPLHTQVQRRLVSLIGAYADDRQHSDFLVDAVRLLVGQYLTEAQLAGRPGAWVIDILARHSPKAYAEHLPGLGRALGAIPAFGRLVLAALQDGERLSYRGDDVVSALRQLSPAAIAPVRDDLQAVGEGAPALDPEVRLAVTLIEVFSAAGDWAAAQAIADAAVAQFGETRREYTRRLAAQLTQAAVAFERAISEGRAGEVDTLGGAWRALKAEYEAAIA